MPSDLSCSACRHHVPARPGYGSCTAVPPTMPIHTGNGVVMTYILTADDLHACGKFAARPTAGAAPVLETKVEPVPDVARMPRPEPARDPQRRDQRRPNR